MASSLTPSSVAMQMVASAFKTLWLPGMFTDTSSGSRSGRSTVKKVCMPCWRTLMARTSQSSPKP
ncbi:hypothetical protein D3C72_1564340 [compost metagenome]